MRDDDEQFANQTYGAEAHRPAFDETTSILDSWTVDRVAKAAGSGRTRLDGAHARKIFNRIMGHYLRELDIQSANRAQMATDEDFGDHEQWTEEEKQVLAERGQDPLVFDVISTSCNWIIGTEKRSRTDFKVLARRKEGTQGAEKKSQLLKYLGDVNRTEFSISDAFTETVRAGLSWLESGVVGDDGDEPIYDRYESWRNVIYDSKAREKDLGDARYIFRHKWADLDTVMATFPDRAGTVRAATVRGLDMVGGIDSMGDDAMDSGEDDLILGGSMRDEDYGDGNRQRLRIIEAWFRIPVQAERLVGGDFHGELFDPWSDGHIGEVSAGRARVRKSLTHRVYVAVMTTAGLLTLEESPYRHNRFPFTPVICYRRSRDGAFYGIIRGMRDAQRDINKRHSKATAILSSNKVIMDKGAVDDLDDFEEEIARPNSIIVKNPGTNLTINADRDLAASHLALMEMSMRMIQSLSGVTDENMGRSTNAKSGIAIQRRQEQGALTTATIFDNLRYARQVHGEKMLSLVEQYMDEGKQFRITNKRGSPDYVTINDGAPENDITRTKANYIISESDFNATIRESQVAELMALMSQLAPAAPQIVMVMLDLLVETMDIPARDEIVNRIRQVTGMEDPDADPDQPDPDRDARKAAQSAQQEMQMRGAMASLAKLEGEAAQKQAQAAKAKADAAKVLHSMAGTTIEQQRNALELAIAMLGQVASVDVADRLYANAVSGGGDMPQPPPDLAAAAPAMPQQQPQPAPTPDMIPA